MEAIDGDSVTHTIGKLRKKRENSQILRISGDYPLFLFAASAGIMGAGSGPWRYARYRAGKIENRTSREESECFRFLLS